MRIRDVIKLVTGSCAVYFVMAACSAYSEEGKRTEAADAAAPPAIPTSPVVANALAEGHKSGARLKLRFWEGSDGSRQFINFFDTELKTACSVGSAKTPDGKFRCLPPVTGEVVFSDAMCTMPVGFVVAKALDPQPPVGAAPKLSGLTDYFQLGPLANPPAAIFGGKFAGGGEGNCGPTAVDPSTNYYTIKAPLAPTAFVEMTVKNE
jgi:hypothetical protein